MKIPQKLPRLLFFIREMRDADNLPLLMQKELGMITPVKAR